MDEKRIEILEANFKELSSELSSLKNLIVGGFNKVEGNFSKIEKQIEVTNVKVDANSSKIDNLANKIVGLDSSTTDGLQEVGTKLESLTEEIQKIGAVTKYSEEYNNLQGLN